MNRPGNTDLRIGPGNANLRIREPRRADTEIGAPGGGAPKRGWQTKTLGDVCELYRDQGTHGGLPYVGLEHIEPKTARFVGSADPYSVKSSTFRFSAEHVLYGRLRPYLSKVLAPDFGGHCSTEILPIRPRPELSRDYLLHWFLAEETVERINATCTGSRMPRANMSAVMGFYIPIPPLPEQHRIVAILDEAFEAIATAKANAEQNFRNARAIFESHLEAVFSKGGESWVERRLGDVVTRLTNGYVGPTRNIYLDCGVPYLLARHVRNNCLDFDGETFVSEEFNRKNKKSMLCVGDVLLVQSGHIGHSAVVTPEHEGHNCHAMIVISPVREVVTGAFLSLFFNSSEMRSRFEKIRSGSTVPHLTCGEVRELLIAMPDLRTQECLVDLARGVRAETDRLAALYQRKLAALDELKKSLLHQAFSGEL